MWSPLPPGTNLRPIHFMRAIAIAQHVPDIPIGEHKPASCLQHQPVVRLQDIPV